MGLMSKILGGSHSRTVEDYAELDLEDASMGSAEATMQVHIAEVGTKADAIDIKDAVYDGDIVIADITRLRTEDSTVEHIVDELRQVAQEVDGDIVRKGEDQMIITPTGIHISREKLGQNL
ncbi:cell division protein SepF [Natrinema soli]|uniref:Cell division protein SepF n=1 Tax=Natrinema soli TaxID=1930624 RepID=A0ABD5STF5_9EURY|nr:cell division protein SepF [Natrinema soli]